MSWHDHFVCEKRCASADMVVEKIQIKDNDHVVCLCQFKPIR
jgi:hypothetical protein